MQSRRRSLGTALLAGALWGGVIGVMTGAGAQQVRDVRTSLYPSGKQVGVVTEAKSDRAWIRIPHRVVPGAQVEFLLFSDGTDTLATGTIRWASTVAPYDAYVVDIKPKKTRHPLNDYDDLWAIAALGKSETEYSTVSEDEVQGGYLAVGFFARTAIPPIPDNVETLEPVRAHIAALRTRDNKTARAIAAAAERALVADPLSRDTDVPAEEAVNYAMLEENLYRFRKAAINDSITEHLLHRLLTLARSNNETGAKISNDLLGTGTKSTGVGGAGR